MKVVGVHAEHDRIDAAPVRPVRTEADHAAAVRRMEALWEAAPGAPEDDELDVLATLVDAYERRRWPVESCSPLEAIRFSMSRTTGPRKNWRSCQVRVHAPRRF